MRHFFLIVFIGFFVSCGGSSVGSKTDDTNVIHYDVIELNSGVTVEKALSVATVNGKNPEMRVTVNWGDHESIQTIPAGTIEDQKSALVDKELKEFDFLLSNFNPNDELELDTYNHLSDVRKALSTEEKMDITTLQIVHNQLPQNIETNPLIEAITSTKEGGLLDMSLDDSEQEASSKEEGIPMIQNQQKSLIGSSQCIDGSNVCDFKNDASYVPLYGSTSVWESGVLQKFVLDQSAEDWFDKNKGGVELKTWIYPPSAADCGTSWNANLGKGRSDAGPDITDEQKGKYTYRDTEAFDNLTSSKYRDCAIGRLRAKDLKKNTLYWTWHSFKKFDKTKNPEITSIWVSTVKCTGIYGLVTNLFCDDGQGDLSWCMCGRDKSTQYLVQYKYNDHPEEEVRWVKNSQ